MTTVYKLFGASGQWLYVGISDVTLNRINNHLSKPWFREVVAAEFEHYDDRDRARCRERELITGHRPAYNIHHNRPSAVKISVSFPEDITAALDEATEADHRHNRSALVVEAVVAWLNRTFDRRAA